MRTRFDRFIRETLSGDLFCNDLPTIDEDTQAVRGKTSYPLDNGKPTPVCSAGFLMNRLTASYFGLGLLVGVFLTVCVFSFLSNGGGQNGNAAGNRVLKLSHTLDQSHPVHLAMEFMRDRLAEKSGGLLTVDIFPNGQLGTETETIEQVQRGVLAMVKTSVAPMEAFIPEMGVFGLPYLFRDEAHYWKILNGTIGKELLELGASGGLRGLIYYESGSRSFYTIDKPILTPDDLDSHKIRVMRSKMSMDMISQLGGSPTPIPFGELYTALQQGMVDGAENNAPSLETSRHYEVAKHYSLDEHTRIPDIVLFSQAIWETLAPHEQVWIQEAADESVIYQRELWEEETAKSLVRLEKNGVTVYRPDKEPFRQKVAPMYKRFEGTVIGALVERIREVQ